MKHCNALWNLRPPLLPAIPFVVCADLLLLGGKTDTILCLLVGGHPDIPDDSHVCPLPVRLTSPRRQTALRAAAIVKPPTGPGRDDQFRLNWKNTRRAGPPARQLSKSPL